MDIQDPCNDISKETKNNIFEFQFLKFIPLSFFLFFILLLPYTLKLDIVTNRENSGFIHYNATSGNKLLKLFHERDNKKGGEPIMSKNDFKISFNKILCSNLQTINNFNIYNVHVIYNTLKISNIIFRYWDRGLIEILGPFGLIKIIHPLAYLIEILLSGKLINYALLIFFFILLFLFFYFFNFLIPINIFFF